MRVDVYINKENEDKWKRFKAAAKRDGTSPSAIFSEAMVNWLVVHEPGNPQTRITSFAATGQTTLASIEGRIREVLLEHGRRGDLTYREVLEEVKKEDYGIPKTFRIPMAERIKTWLIEKNIKVWS